MYRCSCRRLSFFSVCEYIRSRFSVCKPGNEIFDAEKVNWNDLKDVKIKEQHDLNPKFENVSNSVKCNLNMKIFKCFDCVGT